MNHPLSCTLCGLPVTTAKYSIEEEVEKHFCCNGCKMVYSMIMESEEYRNVGDFKQTEIYKTCVAAGVIPGASEDADPAKSYPSDKAREFQNQSDSSTETLTWAFSLSNMWCPACAWIVEDALKKSKGVRQAVCTFSSDRGKVVYDPVLTSPEKIKKLVKSLGYGLHALDEGQQSQTPEFVRLAVTFFLTMNIMMFSWSIYSGFIWQLPKVSVQLLSWPLLLMATVALVYGGYPIHKKALAAIRTGIPGMEVLISIGSITAFLYSLLNVIQSSLHLYFDASSMLILLVLIGKRLEHSAKSKIAMGLTDFFSLVPEKVRICSDQSPKGRYVSVKQLTEGSIFLVSEGEIVAGDGTVTKGEAVIDESSITGEPKPFNAKIRDSVKSGTRIISGSITVKADHVGEESVFGKMKIIMENSLSGKTRQTARFERLLKLFVPVVLSLSVMTYIYSLLRGLTSYESIDRALSVMVISCPCALGVAIPLALVAGVSIAGKQGVLVKDLEAFERVVDLDKVVFDKTGTLTTGKLECLEIQAVSTLTPNDILSIAATLEQESGHYIALAIKNQFEQQNLELLSISNIKHYENGISGLYKNKQVRLGNWEFMEDAAQTERFEEHLPDSAQVVSRIYLSWDNVIEAVIYLGDSVRGDVKGLITDLNNKDFDVFLISGDASMPTKEVAHSTGITDANAYGDLLPHQKAEFIRKQKSNNNKVVMVGDGVNDAPAMAESDLAVAVHSGLNPGDNVASITLMKENPAQLLDFLFLAGKVNRTVKQNLVFALLYNLIGIPVAASGLLNPIIAVTAMLFSSLSVTFNTLFLLKREHVSR
ncbi:MAG: heavy metal translocating P-type ATPase [Proteobacteria bacterium]|nr:heavy metal translocating P-type ATPase [Pseudomonadota bacterium]